MCSLVEEMDGETVSFRTDCMHHNRCVHRTLSLGTQGSLHREAGIYQLEEKEMKTIFQCMCGEKPVFTDHSA